MSKLINTYNNYKNEINAVLFVLSYSVLIYTLYNVIYFTM